MKKLILGLILLVATTTYASNKPDRFIEDYLSFKSVLDNSLLIIHEGGDTAAAIAAIGESSRSMVRWETRMAQEQANRWPGFPTNPWCVLESAYQCWRCLNVLGEDIMYCLMVYDYNMQECKRSTFIPAPTRWK